MQDMYENRTKNLEKARHKRRLHYTIYKSREFVLTATTVSPFCTIFHEIAKEPLSKRYAWSTSYGPSATATPKFGSNKNLEKKDKKT
jgi:hypothetical protein